MHENRLDQLYGYNCGVFVIHYMDIFGLDGKFQAIFDPDENRICQTQMLLRDSEDMNDTCLLCFRNCDYYRKRCVECLDRKTVLIE